MLCPLPLRLPVAALLMTAALWLSGCSAPTGDPGPGPKTPPVAACPAADTPLASLRLESDVRAATGPSTACLAAHTVEPVDDASTPELPVSLTDAEGREVKVTDVSRILAVDISGTIAATVFALGLGDNVVGRDSATLFDEARDLPVVTKTGHTLNAEAILQLAPTVLLTDTSIGPKEVRQQLREAGVSVVMISGERRLESAPALVTEIAGALGVPSRGAELVDRLERSVAAAVEEIAAVVPREREARARMLFLYVRGSANVYYIFGADSGADSLVDAVGGIDVASEIGWEGMKPMTAEALVAAQPDVLVMMTDGLASVGGIDGLLERVPALQQTPAGEHRRVIDMADGEILSFGPRSAEVIRALARALYAPADSPAADAPAGSGSSS